MTDHTQRPGLEPDDSDLDPVYGDARPLIQLTPNQIVAYNLAQARVMKGWTQEQAAEELELYLGVRWSKASFSSERSTAMIGLAPATFAPTTAVGVSDWRFSFRRFIASPLRYDCI